LERFSAFTPDLGICQWFHFEDPRIERAVVLLKDLGVRNLRTGLSWADEGRPNSREWFDRQMRLLDPFDVTVTYCFTPENCGVRPHYTSPPRRAEEFAEFCGRMTRLYA
jgi:beta-xylosidase